MSDSPAAEVRARIWANMVDRPLPATIDGYRPDLRRAWVTLDVPVWHERGEAPYTNASFTSSTPYSPRQRVSLKLRKNWVENESAPTPAAYDERLLDDTAHERLLDAERARFEQLVSVEGLVQRQRELEEYEKQLQEDWEQATHDRTEADAALKQLEERARQVAADEERVAGAIVALKTAERAFETSGARAVLEALGVDPADREPAAPSDDLPSVTTSEGWAELRGALSATGYTASRGEVDRLLLALLTAAASGELLVLGGPPGSGKTSALTLLGEGISARVPAVIPVRPGWIDSTDLLGFLDFEAMQYRPTDFVEALLSASDDDDLSIVIFDEMNIARIENYGADLLSKLEKAHDGGADATLRLYPESAQQSAIRQFRDAGDSPGAATTRSAHSLVTFPPRLRIPLSVVFAGTLNDDATTHALSPKVRDRALVLPLRAGGKGSSGCSLAPMRHAVRSSWAEIKQLFAPQAEIADAMESLTPLHAPLATLGIPTSARFARALRRAAGIAHAVGIGTTGALDLVLVAKSLAGLQILRSDDVARRALDDVVNLVDALGCEWSSSLLHETVYRLERGERLVSLL